MHILLLLSSLFSLLFSFNELFHYNVKDFDIIENKNSYKLILKGQHYFDYSQDGFKFFIPKFTTEFNLKILRYNSTGIINGYLSLNKNFSNLLNVTPSQLKYYITDYKSFGRELDYLLKGYTIPYENVTSISLEAYNIPKKIYNKLGKFFYFKINHDYYNTLKYLVYSFYIVLDKKAVDNYIQQRNLKGFKDFIKNIYNLDLKVPKPKKVIKNKPSKKVPYALKLHLFFYMKEFGFIPKENSPKIEIKTDKFYKLYSNGMDIIYSLKAAFDSYFITNPQKKLNKFTKQLENLLNQLNNPDSFFNIKKNRCTKYVYDKECFKNPTFYHNYIYLQLKKDIPPTDIDEIIAYGDYKTFNDIGKYYFEIGDYKKAEIFLQKAYALKKDPIIIHNLAVLYANHSPLFDIKKVVKYLKESNLEIDYYNLGVLYYIGSGVKENDKKAREYFSKAPHIPYAKENIEIMNKFKIGLK